MFHVRTNIASRALPVLPVAGGVVARARGGLDCFRSPRGTESMHTASRFGIVPIADIATAPN